MTPKEGDVELGLGIFGLGAADLVGLVGEEVHDDRYDADGVVLPKVVVIAGNRVI